MAIDTLKPKQRALLYVFADPWDTRTDIEKAKSVGYGATRMKQLRKLPGWKEEESRLAEAELDRTLSKTYQALAKKIQAGNIRAIELHLKKAGKITGNSISLTQMMGGAQSVFADVVAKHRAERNLPPL